MSDIDHEAEFEEAFKGFGEDPAPAADPANPTPPAAEPPTVEEPKKDDPATPPVKLPEEEATPPAGAEEPEKKEAEPATPPATPPEGETPEEPKPLTKDDVTSIIQNIQTTERNSTKELENTTKDVMEAYYPDGLSNVLTTPEGKKLEKPQDVVEASGGNMTTEEAAQWLMNEQFKLDKQISEIEGSAKQIAETTVNFKRDSIAALQKYEPLFKAYPSLQKKVFDKLMKQVKADTDKGVILSAPDVLEHYDDYLEPYQLAFEHSTQKPATAPVPPVKEEPEPVKPGTQDRLDEGGDGGSTAPNDPNDFAQQVGKELAKGI